VPELSPLAFISYSRNDSEFALRLAQDLKTAGASVWLDQLDIQPGVPWDNAIETALSKSPVMLLVLSPDSAKSDNVRNEISFALEEGKIIIPVLYMDCTVPLRLQRAQRIDFRADYAHGLASLLTYLKVRNPDPEVLEKAAEGDVQRQVAWQAREAEAQRLRDLNEARQQEEDGRLKAEAEAARLDEKAKVDASTPVRPPASVNAPAASPVNAPPPAPRPPVPPIPPAPQQPQQRPQQLPHARPPASATPDNTTAAISYITILPAIMFLLVAPYKNSAFVRFHSIQCLALAGVEFCGTIVLAIIPGIGRPLLFPFWLAIMVGWIICIVKASKGEWFKLPVIGDFALGQAKV
jgi:uncharacterized membrane protein